MSVFLKIVGWSTAIYVVLLVVLYAFQRSLIYHPVSVRPDPAEWGVGEMEAVTVPTADGLDLLGWWKKPADDGAPVILYLHGNAGHLGYRGAKIRPYLDRGYGVLLLAWRGYSGNDGEPDEEGLMADGRAAVAWLRGQGVGAERLVLYGESLGTGVAVPLAADGAGGALVLEAPFTGLAEVAAAHYPFFPVRMLVRDRFDSAARIGDVDVPVMVIHGARDGIVPERMGRALLDAANEPKEGLFIPKAGHVDLYDHGAAAAVIRFIESHRAAKDGLGSAAG